MKNHLLLILSLFALAGCGNFGAHRGPQMNSETGRMEKPDDFAVEVFYEAPSQPYAIIGTTQAVGSEGNVLGELKKQVRRQGGDAVIVTGSGNQAIMGGMVRRQISGNVIAWK